MDYFRPQPPRELEFDTDRIIWAKVTHYLTSCVPLVLNRRRGTSRCVYISAGTGVKENLKESSVSGTRPKGDLFMSIVDDLKKKASDLEQQAAEQLKGKAEELIEDAKQSIQSEADDLKDQATEAIQDQADKLVDAAKQKAGSIIKSRT